MIFPQGREGTSLSDNSDAKMRALARSNLSKIGNHKNSNRGSEGVSKMNDDPIAEPVYTHASLAPPIPGVNPPISPQSPINKLLGDLWRYKWTMILVFIFVAVPVIAGIWIFYVPMYQAKATIQVESSKPYLVFPTEESGQIPQYDFYVNTHVGLMKSVGVLNRVLEYEGIAETQWYQKPKRSLKERIMQSPPKGPFERLLEDLSVRPRPRSEIVDVVFTCEISREAKLILEAFLEEYKKYVNTQEVSSSSELSNKLTEEYNSLERDIKGREDNLEEIIKRVGTTIPEELINAQQLRLFQAEADIKNLENEIELLEWQQQEIEKTINSNDPNGTDEAISEQTKKKHFYHEDPTWQRYREQLSQAQHALKMAKLRLADSNPDLIPYQENVKYAENLLQTRQEELDKSWENLDLAIGNSDNTIASNNEMTLEVIKSELRYKRQKENILNDDYNQQKDAFDQAFETARLLEREQRELADKRALFAAIKDRIIKKNMESNVPCGILTSAAYVPSQPSKDRRLVFSVMALCLALGMGGGSAYLRTLMNQKINTSVEIVSLMQTPFLGHLPEVEPDTIMAKERDLLMEESARMVRTALLSRLGTHEKGKSVLISSAAEGTGKTSAAFVLGRSLALAGKKVLLLDVDLRKKGLSQKMGFAEQPGLLESLKYGVEQKSNIYTTDTLGLSIMPAGLNYDRNELEKTANGVFSTLLDDLRNKYDIIILDGTPLLPVADARILSGLTDGTIMVEREQISLRMDIVDALETLRSSGGQLMGTIFINSTKNRNYYYYDYNNGDDEIIKKSDKPAKKKQSPELETSL